MRAQEMKNFMEDMAFKREQRAMQRQQYADELQQRKRQMAKEDLSTVIQLSAAGYSPLMEGEAGDSYAQKTGLPSVTTPNGSRYVGPTESERTDQARVRGRMKGVEQVAMDEETGGKDDMEEITMPDWIPGERTREVKKGTGAAVLASLYSKKFGKALKPITNRETGDVSFVDDEGNVMKTVKGIAGRASTSGSKKDYEAEVLAGSDQSGELVKRMDDMRPSVYQRLRINPKSATPQEIEGAEKYLKSFVEDAMKKETAAKVAKRRIADRTTVSPPATGAKPPVPASRLQAWLNDPGVKARGVKDINGLRKDLARLGYTIDESK